MAKIYNFSLWLCVLVVAVTLTGCAGSPVRTGWRASENKKNMVGLKPDMTTEQVTNLMGPPDKTEMYRGKNNESVLTYLYITEGMDTYTRRWNETNYTPLIFVNDQLSGCRD